jgi:hypothetical protein
LFISLILGLIIQKPPGGSKYTLGGLQRGADCGYAAIARLVVAIIRDAGDAVTVDVKGLAGTTGWPVDNFKERTKNFLVLVSFLNKIEDPGRLP